jgi:CHAT domain-containing protein
VLPSVASLKALREYAKVSQAKGIYLGIGNPLLDGPQDDARWSSHYKALAQAARDNQTCGKPAAPQQVAQRRRAVGISAKLNRGFEPRASFIREQEPLPETADELCAVADRLGAPSDSVLLGAFATETKIKELSENGQLANYAIIHFATHGALTGQLSGWAEPGLILTPPAEKNRTTLDLERDDGYLTASEIANLRLDADWVVLSACNTAGASGESSEALSGLARAFFYAGTRALLVSHWAVGSESAVKITTRAFAALTTKPSIGRAEALRISMRELIDKGTLAEAHPSQWAPFVVVGEGRR